MIPIPIPSVSQIAEMFKKGATIEAQEQILKLREAALTLQEQNIELREENRKLREERELERQLRFDKNVYWLDRGNGAEPFCPSCRDKDRLLIRLHPATSYNYLGTFVCLVCQHSYE
jgi:hypothetical protein